MTNEDLVAIEQNGYIDDAFGSLGIVKSLPKLADNGDITIDCDGVYKGDSEIIVGRIACRMGRKGWNVDVWLDEESNVIRINYKGEERRMTMDEQKDFKEATDALCEAFANLTEIVFARSATMREAVREVELILSALHGTLAECAVATATKKKGE